MKNNWDEKLLKKIQKKHCGLGLCDNMFFKTIKPFINKEIELIIKKREEVLEQNHKVNIQEVLHDYTDWLLKHDYLSDVDAVAEEPLAVDEYLKEKKL